MGFDPIVPGKKHQKKGRLGKRVASCCYLTQIAAAFDYTFEFILDLLCTVFEFQVPTLVYFFFLFFPQSSILLKFLSNS